MFKVTVDDVEYEVKFFHGIPEPDDYKIYSPEEFRHQFGTDCNIFVGDDLVATAHSDLSIHDTYNRNVGRKIAFTRAIWLLYPFTVESLFRRDFWNAYYKARNNKW